MSAPKFSPHASSGESFPRILSLRIAGGFHVADLLNRYCRAHPDLSAGAIHQYRMALNLVEEWGAKFCDDIFTLDGLRGFTNWLIETPYAEEGEKKRTPETVNGRCDSVWTFWRFAFDEELCDKEPPSRKKLPPLKEPEKNPVAWSVKEFRKIVGLLGKVESKDWFCAVHWETLFACQWYSSERIGALLKCEWSDLAGDVLVVRGETTKDGGTGINRGLPPELIEMLRLLPSLREGAVPPELSKFIWPRPISVDGMRRRYKRILERAGLPFDATHMFHCNRRSSLTEMASTGGPEKAQKHARHSHPSITKRYLDRTKIRGECAADLLPSPFPQREQMNLFE